MRSLYSPAVRLMNRLKYPQKFLLVGLVLVLPFSVVLSQYIMQINLVIDFSTKEQRGLEYTTPLITFFQDIQTFNGLVYASADGNFKSELIDILTAQEAKIEADIQAINVIDERLGKLLIVGTRWTDIKTLWTTVKGERAASILDRDKYSRLVGQILGLITIVGNNSNLILDPDLDTYYLMDLLTNKIPLVDGSYLSDIRSYGTAAAAAATLSSADRTRIVILLGLVRAGLSVQQTSFGYAVDYNPTLTTTLSPAFEDMIAQVNSFLNIVNKEILQGASEQDQTTTIMIDPTLFWNTASKVIDSVFKFHTLLSATENELLQRRIDEKMMQGASIVLVSLAALAVAVYLFGAFYRTVEDAILNLESTTQRIVMGQTNQEVVLNNRDELAHVAISFNKISRELILARDQAIEASNALRQSEAQLRTILDASPIPMMVINGQAGMLYMNPVAMSVFGNRSQLSLTDFLADAVVDQDTLSRVREQYANEGFAKNLEIQFRTAAGEVRNGLATIQPFKFASQDAVLAAVVDITDLKRAQEVEQRQHRLTGALLESIMAITSTLHLNEITDHILKMLERVVTHDVANILILDGTEVGILGNQQLVDMPDNAERQAMFKKMFQIRTPMILKDSEAEGLFKQFLQMANLRSSLLLPIIVHQKVIGLIILGCYQTGYFNDDHVKVLQLFAIQAGIAIQNAQLYRQARMIAILEERHRLARDLHDSVTQTLFSANIIVDALPILMDRSPQKVPEYLQNLQKLTRGAMAEMRSLLVELRAETLVQTELDILITQLCEIFAGKTQIEVEKFIFKRIILPPDIQVVFYRIAQESLNNIAKYARARRVKLNLQAADNVLTLKVVDDGCGFDLNGVGSEHLGLKIMRERANEIHAELVINSQINQGTEIVLTKQLT
jgi:PAS domain S-box-containing protein